MDITRALSGKNFWLLHLCLRFSAMFLNLYSTTPPVTLSNLSDIRVLGDLRNLTTLSDLVFDLVVFTSVH